MPLVFLTVMIYKVSILSTLYNVGLLISFLDLDTAHGAEIWAKYINRHTGRRSDAATGRTSLLS